MRGIVKAIVELCMKVNDGKFVWLKYPPKPQVRISLIRTEAFENEYSS